MTDQTPSVPPPGPLAPPETPPVHPEPLGEAPWDVRRGRRRQIVAWIGLLVACLVVVSSGRIVQLFVGPPSIDDPANVSSFQIEVGARFTLGARSVLGEAMTGSLEDSSLRDLAPTLDEIAKDTDKRTRDVDYVDHFRATLVLAEFKGADDGAKRIDALLNAPDVPEGILEDAGLMRRVYESGADSLTTDEQDRLIDRHGWIGRLGVSFAEPPSAPQRAKVLSDAEFTFFALMSLCGLALIALPIGFTLFVVALIMLDRGRIRPRYRPDLDSSPAHHASFLETIALFMGALALLKIAGELLARADPNKPWVSIAGLGLYAAQWAMLLIVFWPLVRGVKLRRFVTGLGWIPGRGVFHELGAGIAGYLAGMPILLVGFLLMIVLMWVSGIQPTHPIVERARQHDIMSILFIYSVAVIWAPLVEESMFRGAFYHNLRRWLHPVVSALIVAFVFAGVHPQGFVAMPPLMALAFVFAMIREWRGSIFGCMAAHALHNGILMTVNIVLLARIF